MTDTAAMVFGIIRNQMGNAIYTGRWQMNCNALTSRIKNYMDYLTPNKTPDVLCLSHLRWKFVFQRPQHLMSRFAQTRRVFFVEEPVFGSPEPSLAINVCPASGVFVVTPQLKSEADRVVVLQRLLSEFVRKERIDQPIAWFYTPMALQSFPPELSPSVVVYDCMDELSMFRCPP